MSALLCSARSKLRQQDVMSSELQEAGRHLPVITAGLKIQKKAEALCAHQIFYHIDNDYDT